MIAVVWRYLNVLRCGIRFSPLHIASSKYRLCLLAIGYLWLLALPLSELGVDTYVDENALQPSQVPSPASLCSMRTDCVHL